MKWVVIILRQILVIEFIDISVERTGFCKIFSQNLDFYLILIL